MPSNTNTGLLNVGQAYQKVFGRAADAEGAAFWQGKVDSGEIGSQDQLESIFRGSQEFTDKSNSFVNELYGDTFGREADAEGATYWNNQLKNGTSQSDVAAAFTGSQEYSDNAGSNNADSYISNLYKQTTGNDITDSGLDTWRGKLLDNGYTRDDLAADMSASTNSPLVASSPAQDIYNAPTTVADNLSGILDANSPLMARAHQSGMRQASNRGLLNTTLAGEMAQNAVIANALPIASQDSAQEQARWLQNDAQAAAKELQMQVDQASFDRLEAQLGNNLDVMGLEKGSQERIAAITALAQADQTYSSTVTAIMNNPDIPADVRDQYLQNAATRQQAAYQMVEDMFQVDLDWPAIQTTSGNDAANYTDAQYISYVDGNPDLLAAYQSDPQGKSKSDWGRWHYETYGQSEGRTVGGAT